MTSLDDRRIRPTEGDAAPFALDQVVEPTPAARANFPILRKIKTAVVVGYSSGGEGLRLRLDTDLPQHRPSCWLAKYWQPIDGSCRPGATSSHSGSSSSRSPRSSSPTTGAITD